MTGVNPIRGETTVRIGDIEIVMVATMDGLARLSDALRNPTLGDLINRLFNAEPAAVRAAIRLLTIGGADAAGKKLKADAAAKAALDAMTLSDSAALTDAFSSLFAALMRPEKEGSSGEGKAGASTQ